MLGECDDQQKSMGQLEDPFQQRVHWFSCPVSSGTYWSTSLELEATFQIYQFLSNPDLLSILPYFTLMYWALYHIKPRILIRSEKKRKTREFRTQNNKTREDYVRK